MFHGKKVRTSVAAATGHRTNPFVIGTKAGAASDDASGCGGELCGRA